MALSLRAKSHSSIPFVLSFQGLQVLHGGELDPCGSRSDDLHQRYRSQLQHLLSSRQGSINCWCKVALLCFPEAFAFVSYRDGESVEIAEPIDGPIVQRYCSLARESNIWLSLGGFQEKGPDDKHLHNTHVLVDDTGSIKNFYRKIHLFDVDVPGNMVYRESNFTTPGDDIVVEDSPVGRLGLTVCYDIRFPELYQLLRFQHNAQVLLVPAALTRVTGEAHWEILLRARAIETQCYVVAAAQAGKHNERRESYGDSLIIDPWGRIIARLPASKARHLAKSFMFVKFHARAC
ncbi:Nitrilase protein [Dioscorea alata]|uniref:Nitrilase protein n=1 Tax=Dioscorea alata TaxID=55571 RepID=A0ACB7V2X8_DIOAL|nr:Nitrilase protein [Dioscorea alata]